MIIHLVQTQNFKVLGQQKNHKSFMSFFLFEDVIQKDLKDYYNYCQHMMENSGQIFSLWVGQNSQEVAHHFYALQAEQFFDESQDPIEHSCVWKLYDATGERKRPYFLTFDTEIPHLNYLRHTNHAKMIKQMEKSQMQLEHYFFPMQFKKPENPQVKSDEKDSYLYERWQASEKNYSIIDKNFIQDCDSWEHWKQIFRAGSQQYENKVRKHLESFDFLKYITFTSDLERNGFSQEILFYLRDQCAKKDIHFFQLQGNHKNGFYQVSQLQSFAQIGSICDVFLKLKTQLPQFQFFQSQNPFIHMAPVFNSLITPLCLKNSSQQNYLNNLLINPRRNIFDFAYTLPLIDKDLHLQKTTNIFDYLLQDRHESFFKDQDLKRAGMNENQSEIQKQQILNELKQDSQNRINYGADYLGLRRFVKQNQNQKVKEQLYTELISEAYVLKGHVKDFEKIFKPNCELLDLKYLEGILCNYSQNKIKYTKPYQKPYGQIVLNYPFHLVMFQHKNFGEHLRNVATFKNKKFKHELEEEWKQDVMAQADFYKENKQQEQD